MNAFDVSTSYDNSQLHWLVLMKSVFFSLHFLLDDFRLFVAFDHVSVICVWVRNIFIFSPFLKLLDLKREVTSEWRPKT